MPKHVCGADLGASMRALGRLLGSRNLGRVADGSRCRETAIKTKRGAGVLFGVFAIGVQAQRDLMQPTRRSDPFRPPARSGELPSD
jgi:hypothetical protein